MTVFLRDDAQIDITRRVNSGDTGGKSSSLAWLIPSELAQPEQKVTGKKAPHSKSLSSGSAVFSEDKVSLQKLNGTGLT